MKNEGPKKLSEVLSKYKQEEDKYISREFQQYAYDLAMELNDPKRMGIYMRLAKTQPREQLEAARRFVSDAENAKSKARLFMWKLKELKKKTIKEK
jgi:hypothetical protein